MWPALALSRFGDRSTLQPGCPSELGPDTGRERTAICAHFSPPTPAEWHFRVLPALGVTIVLPTLSSGWGLHGAPG